MTDGHWHIFEAFEPLVTAVKDATITLLEEAIASRGGAVIALPGGHTPVPIFEAIARHDLDWSKVTILPTDDRFVAGESLLSNSSMLARIFDPPGATLISFESTSDDLAEAAALANDRIMGLAWPLDLVWTGVGTDGHTASILVGPDIELAFHGAAGRRIVGITPDPLPPEAPVTRVTMTSAALADTRALTIVIKGAGKRDMVERALAEGASTAIPIGRVLADTPLPAEIYWCP